MLREESYLICFDPGHTTGFVAVYYIHQSSFVVARAEEILWHQRFDRTSWLLDHYLNQREGLSAIIVEDYRLRKDKAEDQAGSEMPSSKMIGTIETLAWLATVPGTNPRQRAYDLVKFQMPGIKQRTQIVSRHVPMVCTFGGRDHVSDAYKHGRYFIMQERSKTGI
jgi:hypothetical protein